MRSPCSRLQERTAPCPCCHKTKREGSLGINPAHPPWLAGIVQADIPFPSPITCLRCWFGVGITFSTSPGCQDLQSAMQANQVPQAWSWLYSKLGSLHHSPLRPQAQLVLAQTLLGIKALCQDAAVSSPSKRTSLFLPVKRLRSI